MLDSVSSGGSQTGQLSSAEYVSGLGEAFGSSWVPVRFCYELPEGEPQKLRFCEALKEAVRTNVLLTRDSISCMGARRSFGWALGLDEGLAEDLATRQTLPLGTARKMIRAVPKLDGSHIAVEAGTVEAPDVLMSYAQPPTVMKIARAAESGTGEPLRPVLSSVMSACGNAAVRSFVSGDVAISFGCDQSRASRAMGRDRMVVAIPAVLVERLLEAGRRT